MNKEINTIQNILNKPQRKPKNYKLPFGKYEGKTIKEIGYVDTNYLYFLISRSYNKALIVSCKNELEQIMATMTTETFKFNKLQFGKYKGKTFGHVLVKDRSYLEWLRMCDGLNQTTLTGLSLLLS
jgi:uncharacterized protein (DUF3820 family)